MKPHPIGAFNSPLLDIEVGVYGDVYAGPKVYTLISPKLALRSTSTYTHHRGWPRWGEVERVGMGCGPGARCGAVLWLSFAIACNSRAN